MSRAEVQRPLCWERTPSDPPSPFVCLKDSDPLVFVLNGALVVVESSPSRRRTPIEVKCDLWESGGLLRSRLRFVLVPSTGREGGRGGGKRDKSGVLVRELSEVCEVTGEYGEQWDLGPQ